MIYLRFLLFSNQTSFQSSTKMLITKSDEEQSNKDLVGLKCFYSFCFPQFSSRSLQILK